MNQNAKNAQLIKDVNKRLKYMIEIEEVESMIKRILIALGILDRDINGTLKGRLYSSHIVSMNYPSWKRHE